MHKSDKDSNSTIKTRNKVNHVYKLREKNERERMIGRE
jgi:hypothetical protein